MIDYHEKYCSKCKHREVSEMKDPCKTCIDKFFEDPKDRKFIFFEKEKEKK